MSDELLIGVLATLVVGELGVIAALGIALGVYRKQKRQADQQRRFLENLAANRHNSVDVTFKGTTVRPGTGQAQYEGFAPTVTMTKPDAERTWRGQNEGEVS